MVDNEKIRFVLPGVESIPENSAAHGPASRGAPVEELDILAGVTVRQHFDLSAQQRAAGQWVTTPPLFPDEVIALEMEGSFVLYTSAGRLADDLRRIAPTAEIDGTISLDALRQQAPATRGPGDWMISALSIIGVDEKWLIGKAAEKAKEWGGAALVQGASWAGTKALMWSIEAQLACEPGKLYAWRVEAGGELLASAAADMGGQRDDAQMLVFIHGTGSSTRGSFGELRHGTAENEWLALRQKFGRHIYGFEHRTFSESPIENALQLAGQLPAGARISLVTHSRGGLVGDLLCAAGYDDLGDTSFMRTDPRLAQANEEDRKYLRALAEVLNAKQFVIERYVRVASPAQGTLLASAHIDAFLSGLLHLIGMVPGFAGTPVYAVVKRVLLQIAKNRTDPRLVPGIEAMLPDSPLAALLGQARPQGGAHIAVIAGDIEGNGLLKRAGVFLTDYLLFETEDNDLVVDTESMFGGIARDAGHYVFDQGEDVSHFRYFANPRTRRALQAWMTVESPAAVTDFTPIIQGAPPTVMQRGLRDVTGTLPVVVIIPDMMGSHLRAQEERIWLNFLGLGRGKLTEIAWGRPEIAPDGLFSAMYGDLCNYLSRGHDAVPFDYDWRAPLDQAAALLRQVIEQALEKTGDARQPVRLMTHGMGGLVVRALIAHHRATWDRLAARAGAHWVMLGTPNKGSHGTVESLLGLSGTARKLAMLHRPLGVQGVVDILAGLPGVLQGLPRPGFSDTGNARHNYYAPAFWANFKMGNDSLWYGNSIGAIPTAEMLESVKQAWSQLDEDLPNPERIAYVAGYGHETPCGIERVEGPHRRLRMVGTLNGDGKVTHDAGLLDVLKRNQRVWFVNADHAGLASSVEHFPALLELLERGETLRLQQVKPTVRGAEALVRYEPGPVLYPTGQDLEDALIGRRRPARRQANAKHVLTVCCRAMDLRHAVHPILVGHYEGDAISGTEAQIDRYLLNNRLTLRHHLDAYPGSVGTCAVVLDEPSQAQAIAGVRRGAIVVGLGSLGELKATGLAATVRQGVLRYLLQLHDRSLKRDHPKSVGMTSLLLGYNSTTHISIEDSMAIVTRAVMEANRDFANASGAPLLVGQIEFVELSEDVAISAAKAVREIGGRLATDAKRLGFRIEPAQMLDCSRGMRLRIEAMPSSFDYWPRLIVTAADQHAEPAADSQPGFARTLRYVFLSMRARAEAVGHQRQPGLIENLLAKSIQCPRYQPELARALFHLLVPHEFKDTARQTDNLVLVVDELTANLPWEMLIADDGPLIKTTAMVRQLTSGRFRKARATQQRRAYVVGNPSTAGYYKTIPQGAGTHALPDLPGAAAEARAVADLMIGLGYQVAQAQPGAEGTDVINRLYDRPYRILHISGHGVFQAGQAGNRRTGVVLSDGLLLTAAEIAALEVVPDLVFLNCCHSGQVNAGLETAYNRLAYSVAQELIENGVRTVIVAGWAVDDNAARHFAEAFYTCFLREGSPFGKSVYRARLSTYESFPDSNTWGAFQAYGEPSYVIDPEIVRMRGAEDFRPVAPQELIARIELIRNELAYNRESGKHGDAQLGKTIERLLRCSTSETWLQAPEVLYSLARLYSDAGDFEQARQCYEKAAAREDKLGQVPIAAIEQLANMEVRIGAERAENQAVAGEALIRRGLDRLLALTQAAGGMDELPGERINAERCGLIGSAYKRLARVLPQWSAPQAPVQPAGARQALEMARDWYARGQGDPCRPGFNAYNTHNRIVLDRLLGTPRAEDAKLAMQAGELAERQYERTRDYFDLVMSADGTLIAALVDGAFEQANKDEVQVAAERIVGRYRGLREKLPETARWLDSVLSQIRLLVYFYREQAQDGAGTTAQVAQCLEHIASALEDSEGLPARNQQEIRLAGDAAMGGETVVHLSPP